MDLQTAALFGATGGLIPDVLRAISERHQPGPPDYLTSWFFWVSLVLLAGIGGGACYLLEPQTTISALAIGYSAPSIISNLLGTTSKAPPSASQAKGIEAKRKEREIHQVPYKGPIAVGDLLAWWGR